MFNAIILLSVFFQSSIDDPNRFNGFLILAYSIMWLIGIVYVVSLVNRQRNLRQDLQLMQRLLVEERDEEEEPDPVH